MRSTGILLSVTSLPSKYGIGCFDKNAYDFVDWLAKAGQKYWQILPLGATSHGGAYDSPYQALSAFAGNPYFISLDELKNEGVLTAAECKAAQVDSGAAVDYEWLNATRLPLLRKAYERSNISADPGFGEFCRENSWWLEDYALYMAVRAYFKEQSRTQWPEDIRKHYGPALDYYREKLYFEVEFHKYLQFKFDQQDRNYSVTVYNRELRKLLKFCRLDRPVAKFNEDKGENEYFPLYEVASSRLARKTHVDIMNKVQINAYVAGLHAEGSDAVFRYTNLELTDRFALMNVAFSQKAYHVNPDMTLVKRGRPKAKKTEESTAPQEQNTAMKPKRGRPRKLNLSGTTPMTDSLNGSTAMPTEQPPKRRPGRPRKEKPVDTTPKRRPGRPKKVQPASVDAGTQKRGRGRPRKNPL